MDLMAEFIPNSCGSERTLIRRQNVQKASEHGARTELVRAPCSIDDRKIKQRPAPYGGCRLAVAIGKANRDILDNTTVLRVYLKQNSLLEPRTLLTMLKTCI